jgi:hypothetical protein
VTGDGEGEPRRWFFIHLQKTAGIELFRRLRHHFGTRAVYPMPEYEGTFETALGTPELVARFAAHRDEIRVVAGHFPLCTLELLDAPFMTFTVLREPVERTLSALRHLRTSPAFRGAPLEEVYADDRWDHRWRRDALMCNHMVRMLSLRADELTYGALTLTQVDDDRLAVAKANLAERIDVFGLQEHFEEFCDELRHRYGWDLGPPEFANRTTPADASPQLRARILEDNAADAELYAFAIDLWSRRRGANSG